MESIVKVFLLFTLTLAGCSIHKTAKRTYESGGLKITPLTDNVFVHVSYLEVPEYGNVPCNGVVFVNKGRAVVFDTPATDSASLELLQWIKDRLNCEVEAVVVTHFHDDCLGALKIFHDRMIKSYANNLTITLAEERGKQLPQVGFDKLFEMDVNGMKVINEFVGEGHTRDNIVSYIPDKNVLFGGCLVKEVNAGKGNLADANTDEWSNTIRKIKQKYPDVKYVVPGHGKSGGRELLDYTIELFERQ